MAIAQGESCPEAREASRKPSYPDTLREGQWFSFAISRETKRNGVAWERWPKIVGEALSRLQNKGTWVDYVRSLVARNQLQTC